MKRYTLSMHVRYNIYIYIINTQTDKQEANETKERREKTKKLAWVSGVNQTWTERVNWREEHIGHTPPLAWCGNHATLSQLWSKRSSVQLISEFRIRFRLRNRNSNSILNMKNYITFHFKFGIEFRFPIKTRNVPNVSEIIQNI